MAKLNRGDVIVASVPEGGKFKVRPLLVVQNDKNNARLTNVIAVMVSSNTALASKEPTQVLVDLATPEGQQSGLKMDSAVKCENFYTVPVKRASRIGQLPPALISQVDNALKVSLALS